MLIHIPGIKIQLVVTIVFLFCSAFISISAYSSLLTIALFMSANEDKKAAFEEEHELLSSPFAVPRPQRC